MTKGKLHDWGILGYAFVGGHESVVSSWYVRRTTKDRRLVRERLAKMAVHEVGHALGLEHCATRGCLMEDAKGTVLTCDREHDLCPICREKLRRQGLAIPASPRAPWSKPSPRAGPTDAYLKRIEKLWR